MESKDLVNNVKMAKEGEKIRWEVWAERFKSLAAVGLAPLVLVGTLNFVVDPIVAVVRGLLGYKYSPILSGDLSLYVYQVVVLGIFLSFIAVILFGIAKIGDKHSTQALEDDKQERWKRVWSGKIG